VLPSSNYEAGVFSVVRQLFRGSPNVRVECARGFMAASSMWSNAKASGATYFSAAVARAVRGWPNSRRSLRTSTVGQEHVAISLPNAANRSGSTLAANAQRACRWMQW